MDFDAAATLDVNATTPIFIDEADKIRRILALKSQHEIKTLQHVSDQISKRVMTMNQDPKPPKKQALWAYTGDVYKGFNAKTISPLAATWAQRHIRIPSGMYGIIKPYDEIVPYRLEMKTKLSVQGSADLYDFWSDRLARTFEGEDIVVLASDEYARAVTKHIQAKAKIYNVSFVDSKPDGKEAKVPIYNKIMRGVTARWLADRQATAPTDIKEFHDKGYRYSASRSSSHHFVFYRATPGPIVL